MSFIKSAWHYATFRATLCSNCWREQSKSPINATKRLIGSRQQLMHARKIAVSCHFNTNPSMFTNCCLGRIRRQDRLDLVVTVVLGEKLKIEYGTHDTKWAGPSRARWEAGLSHVLPTWLDELHPHCDVISLWILIIRLHFCCKYISPESESNPW